MFNNAVCDIKSLTVFFKNFYFNFISKNKKYGTQKCISYFLLYLKLKVNL